MIFNKRNILTSDSSQVSLLVSIRRMSAELLQRLGELETYELINMMVLPLILVGNLEL